MSPDPLKKPYFYDNESGENKSESLINTTLDIFLFGPLFTLIPQKYITRQFVSGFLLSVFLICLYETNHFDNQFFSVHMIALYIIVIFTVAELIRKNFPILNSWFSNDQKSMNFFKNIESMTDSDMRNFVQFHIFSSKCINKMLSIVKSDVNRIPSDILEYALTTQDLTKENLDLLFSKGIIIDEKIITFVLFQKMDQLTEKNVIDIYETYQSNDTIIRLLFATQKGSKKLISAHSELAPLFIKFQKNKEYKDSWLERFPPSWFFIAYRKNLILVTFFVLIIILAPIVTHLLIIFGTSCPSNVENCSYAYTFMTILFPVVMFLFIILSYPVKYIVSFVRKRYFEHFCLKVEQS